MLSGIEIICVMCHHVHHYAQTERLQLEGAMSSRDVLAVRRHFRKVNNCTAQAFFQHYEQAYNVWEDRSRKTWRVDYGIYSDLLVEARAVRKKWHAKHGKAQSLYDAILRAEMARENRAKKKRIKKR